MVTPDQFQPPGIFQCNKALLITLEGPAQGGSKEIVIQPKLALQALRFHYSWSIVYIQIGAECP